MSRNYTEGAGEGLAAASAASAGIILIAVHSFMFLFLWLHKYPPKRVAAYTGIGTAACLIAAVTLNYFGDRNSDIDMILVMLLMCALFILPILFIFHLVKSALPKYKREMGELDVRVLALFLALPIAVFVDVLASIAGVDRFFVGIAVCALPLALIMLSGSYRKQANSKINQAVPFISGIWEANTNRFLGEKAEEWEARMAAQRQHEENLTNS